MADTITIKDSANADKVVATDEVTRNAVSEHQQVMKLSLGADGACDLLVDSGQQTMAASVPVVLASDQSAVPITPPSAATWVVSSGYTAHVAAARTTLVDLFNASGSGVVLRVRAIYTIPTLAAVTGVGLTYEIIRTSAIGTGGAGATPVAFDTASAALPGGVTARTKPTGGATTSATLLYVTGSSEETTPYAGMASVLNRLNFGQLPSVEPLVLREGYGLKVDQTTSSSVGSVNVVLVFTVH